MKAIGRIVLILLVAAAALAAWKREEVTRLMAVLDLFSEEKIVANFSDMPNIFLSRPLGANTGTPSPLPVGTPATLPPEVAPWIKARAVTGLVVLKGGELVHEAYFQGTSETDMRINWSISKSYLSVLFGTLVDEGVISSIDEPVVTYAPELAGTGYAEATIKDVLQMSSGVSFDEDYLDFWSDINKMGRVLALGGSMDRFAEKQNEVFVAPGETWQYVSIDTHVIGMVIRGATGRDIPDLLAEKVIGPMGLEADPIYLTDGYGVAFVLGGLVTRTRDNARFGQMIANGGAWNGQQIVPAAWITASTLPSANTAPGAIGYGYQWWIPQGAEPGQVLARGIYGQYIYIDPLNDVVIAVHAADRAFREPGVNAQNVEMLRLIAESLS